MQRYVVVDVFTETPLEGNPLAVFTQADGLPVDRMQRVAAEMNLSETVFVLPPEQGGDTRIRIFTPLVELPSAGHPTLGTAFALCQQRGLNTITLETGVGLVQVDFDGAGPHGPGLPGWMRQPVPGWEPYDRVAELLAALGVDSSRLPVETYSNGPRHVYVALDDEEAVRRLRPDLNALPGLLPRRGVSCFAGAGARWKSRCFLPSLGVNEDPATGSAAGPLAVHLARHGWTGFGQRIEIRQGEEIGRPSILYARAEGDANKVTEVAVGGSAVVVARGEFLA
ncbi:MAG TPA: PhzF family phenazine biosynthesis protein [Streptosporangiaceae bacterium]|nr:PhzF family phenazine biosynthesis protein [Streptosporangiaceae bacterium]